jgi:hypothetical protein
MRVELWFTWPDNEATGMVRKKLIKSTRKSKSDLLLVKVIFIYLQICVETGSGVSVQRNSVSIVVYYFIQIIRYMFRSYDHLQVGNIYIGN